MSILVFIDESRWQRPGEDDYYATIAGVALNETSYDDFCLKLMRLKGRFFKKPGIGEYPLLGRSLASHRALASYRKVEFVGELFSLCRLEEVAIFSTTKRCAHQNKQNNANSIPVLVQKGAISGSDWYNEEVCSLLLAYLIERINTFMLESNPGQLAKLVFKNEETHRDRVLGSSVMNFMYKTTFGGGFHGVMGSPLFAPASHSIGLQIADIFAYIINQNHGGRREVKEFFEEVQSMEFVSSIRQGEFEIRGMNIIE
ncbi:hypothetical protein CEE37_00150 [candidate division LCP-89 bacterium B3_LCP]|uniref:DUF3800 domain-containing protein n=1 Tax=candidate division LCP-89 bacterium B3_LCP TaxID=2012998 RepID=A0A532V4R0_UNCL8|nr:MAG: hypothetical protein CEE37_00150 [candidate division LCP-89 bacterium B3_LCP]